MARNERGLFDKSFWWRQGCDRRTETTSQLSVTGRRLDPPARMVAVSDATNGFEQSMGARGRLLVPVEAAGGSGPSLGSPYGRT